VSLRSSFGGAELRERFVQLVGKFYQLADRGDGAAGTLRRLARDAGNDLHGVGDTFRAAHLLFGSERDFLYKFGRLTYYVGNSVQCATGLVGKGCTTFDFFRAFFHDHHGFVRSPPEWP